MARVISFICVAVLVCVLQVECRIYRRQSCPSSDDLNSDIESCMKYIDLGEEEFSSFEATMEYCRSLDGARACVGNIFRDCTAWDLRSRDGLKSENRGMEQSLIRSSYRTGCDDLLR
jgi:hypothetical protein